MTLHQLLILRSCHLWDFTRSRYLGLSKILCYHIESSGSSKAFFAKSNTSLSRYRGYGPQAGSSCRGCHLQVHQISINDSDASRVASPSILLSSLGLYVPIYKCRLQLIATIVLFRDACLLFAVLLITPTLATSLGRNVRSLGCHSQKAPSTIKSADRGKAYRPEHSRASARGAPCTFIHSYLYGIFPHTLFLRPETPNCTSW